MSRAVALIDGEHYAPVVRDALAATAHDVVAAVLLGGTEKLRGGDDYGVPLVSGVEEAIAAYAPDLVLDLSDEPVLGPVERMALASHVLAHGVPYEGADFRFDAPSFTPVDMPSLAVVGTGKRVGKTAVTGHVARLLSADRHVVGVETVGCRRCGGGLAGAVAVSNVAEGARVAAGLHPDLAIFDGSGAAFPPVAVGRRVLVTAAHLDPAVATGYLNRYRLLLADLVVITMAEERVATEDLREAVARVVPESVPVVATVLRPRPAEPVAGRRVAFFCTAPPRAHRPLERHLREVHGADVVHVSGNLSDRMALRSELASVDADVFLVELKAAAVDVVAEEALARGADVVLAANDVVPLPGEPDLDAELRRLAEEATDE
jgi:cyclic 2,3-diphosphoglycerate synthetase